MTKKVLILDNDEDMLNVMQEALIYGGFEVKVVKEAINIFLLIDEYKPDMLIIDYLLDGVNGGELCHEVKSNGRTRNLPVIIISAYPMVLKSLGDYSCDAFVPKPFDLYQLIEKVTELVKLAPQKEHNVQ